MSWISAQGLGAPTATHAEELTWLREQLRALYAQGIATRTCEATLAVLVALTEVLAAITAHGYALPGLVSMSISEEEIARAKRLCAGLDKRLRERCFCMA